MKEEGLLGVITFFEGILLTIFDELLCNIFWNEDKSTEGILGYLSDPFGWEDWNWKWFLNCVSDTVPIFALDSYLGFNDKYCLFSLVRITIKEKYRRRIIIIIIMFQKSIWFHNYSFIINYFKPYFWGS